MMNPMRTVCVCLLGCFAVICPAYADLVHHWRFDGDPNDSAGSYNWVVAGSVTYTDEAAEGTQALALDGSGAAVGGVRLVEEYNQKSVTMWIKAESTVGQQLLYDELNHFWGLALRIDNHQLQGAIVNDRVRQVISAPFTDTDWVRVVLTFDSGEFKLFVNKTEVAAETAPFETMDEKSGHSGLGQRNGGDAFDTHGLGAFFTGLMDDVRIYDHALSPAEINTLGGLVAEQASEPYPPHSASGLARDSLLTWTPGLSALVHDVYFGTDFTTVGNAGTTDPQGVLLSRGQTETAFDPGRLEFGKTYYWRVDAIGATPGTVIMGDVWSFTVEAFVSPIPATAIVATASSRAREETSGPEKTIDGSGLVGDLHGTHMSDMWRSAELPAWIEYAFDKTYKLHEMQIWNANSPLEGLLGFGARDVTVEVSTDGLAWAPLAGVTSLVQAPQPITDQYHANNIIDLTGVVAKFVKITIHSVHGAAVGTSLSEVRFLALPTFARNPQPADGAVADSIDAVLAWDAGREADTHRIILSADLNAVQDDSAEIGSSSVPSFDLASLDILTLSETYYWKIVEVNDAENPSEYAGDIWTFTTPDHLIVDDFEGYTDNQDAGLAIFQTWTDGWKDPTNGSQAGYSDEPFAEQTIVHGGDQSMPMIFDNSASTTGLSEVTRSFAQAQDWTQNDIQILSLYFARGLNNVDGRLYVKINNTQVDYPEPAPDLMPPGWNLWTPWNIDLTSLDRSQVKDLTIGMAGADAQGLLFVDDIRLYRTAPQERIVTWFEAESGTFTEPMQLYTDDPSASAGQYIGTPEDAGSVSFSVPGDGVATYPFTVPQDGDYRIALRVIVPDFGSDSFWVRVAGVGGWIRFDNIVSGDTWHWDMVRDTEKQSRIVDFPLTAGTHTLEIVRRDDGTLLDAVAILKK